MTKTISFDLHFTETEVVSLSDQGAKFLVTIMIADEDLIHDYPALYRKAIAEGLHVTFDTALVRDELAAYAG